MLQRHIKIVANIFSIPHCINYFHWEFGRIGVMQPNPFQTGKTEDDVEELKSFLIKMQFDRVGIFSYSHEEGT